MPLNIKPPFTGNDNGTCVVYAIANLLHFFPNAKNAIKNFQGSQGTGYANTEMIDIVRFISSNDILPVILAYNPQKRLVTKDFDSLYPFHLLCEDESLKQINKHLFVPIILNVVSKNDVKHSIGAYYEVDTKMLILMDSAGNGNIAAMEVHAAFSSFVCYGISVLMNKSQGEYYPVFIEKSELKIYGS